MLDIGSATGHLVNLLKNHYNCVGIDTSIDMIKRANYNYPDNNYIREKYNGKLFDTKKEVEKFINQNNYS